jgi:hypothetical protein
MLPPLGLAVTSLICAKRSLTTRAMASLTREATAGSVSWQGDGLYAERQAALHRRHLRQHGLAECLDTLRSKWPCAVRPRSAARSGTVVFATSARIASSRPSRARSPPASSSRTTHQYRRTASRASAASITPTPVGVGACGSMDSAWTGAPVACTGVLSNISIT